MKAIIRNGVPEQVFAAFTDNNGVKHPANVLTLWTAEELAAIDVYPVADGAVPDGHVITGSSLEWDGTTVTRVFTSGAVPLADQQAAKLQALAERRYQAESGGTTFNGFYLATDPVSQAKITAAYVKASDNPDYAILSWKFGTGIFAPLDAATIIAAANAMEAHVQACFSNEASLSAAISAATDGNELALVDIEAGWPT